MMAACRMNKNRSEQHIPVMLNEAVSHLVTDASGIYIDATFGRGSHSKAILDRLDSNGKLIAFDKDPEAIAHAKQAIQDERFTIVHASFATLLMYLQNVSLVGKISGILFDLGVSSPQLDNPERGFSFSRDGKLDMRMDTTQGQDAMTWLASVDEKTLADILWTYGEERFSRRIARNIVTQRAIEPIQTTARLAEIIKYSVPKKKFGEDKHPATRSFQAIRIFINQELSDLEQALVQAYDALSINGRLVVISFHSLEDRIVKQFIKYYQEGEVIPRGLPIKASSYQSKLRAISKAVKPGFEEVNGNPRARSAILRIAEKMS